MVYPSFSLFLVLSHIHEDPPVASGQADDHAIPPRPCVEAGRVGVDTLALALSTLSELHGDVRVHIADNIQ